RENVSMLSLLRQWPAIGTPSVTCWKPSVHSSCGIAGRGSGPANAAGSRRMTSRRRCAWPPSRRCRATRTRGDRSWPLCTALRHTRSPTPTGPRRGTARNRRTFCRSGSRPRTGPSRWRSTPNRPPGCRSFCRCCPRSSAKSSFSEWSPGRAARSPPRPSAALPGRSGWHSIASWRGGGGWTWQRGIIMVDFGRWNPNWNPGDGGQPSLQDIHRSEQFIEALSTGRPVYANDPGEDELAYLMAGWRDRARNAPMRATVTEQDAVAALQRGLPRPRGGAPRPGRRFSLSVVGSAAGAGICLGGFGALVAGAGPGDPLYGLRTMLFGDVVRDDPVVLAAQTQLAEVEQLIAQGDWEAAQERLQAVTTTVATVGDETRKQ